MFCVYTHAEGCKITERSLQDSEGDLSDPSITRRVDLAKTVCPFLSKQTSLSVLTLTFDKTFPKLIFLFQTTVSYV